MTNTPSDFEFLNQVKVTPVNLIIRFPAILEREHKQELTMYNPTVHQMSFKICSAPAEIVAFNPSCGYVKAKDKVVIMVSAGKNGYGLKPKSNLTFFVRWVIAGKCPDDADDMWIGNVVPNRSFQAIKMKIQFGEEPEPKTVSQRSLKDQSTASEMMLD